MLSCLLTGHMYSDYHAQCIALQLAPMHHSTFDRYLGYFKPKIEQVAQESMEIIRYLVVRYGECIDHLILTNDWFWLTRGHNSHNGTGTICDLQSGGVLAYKHYCQRVDNLQQFFHGSVVGKTLEQVCDEALESDESRAPPIPWSPLAVEARTAQKGVKGPG